MMVVYMYKHVTPNGVTALLIVTGFVTRINELVLSRVYHKNVSKAGCFINSIGHRLRSLNSGESNGIDGQSLRTLTRVVCLKKGSTITLVLRRRTMYLRVNLFFI
jgi:hypothetical protein